MGTLVDSAMEAVKEELFCSSGILHGRMDGRVSKG